LNLTGNKVVDVIVFGWIEDKGDDGKGEEMEVGKKLGFFLMKF